MFFFTVYMGEANDWKMEKRIFGIILTVLGIVGLILAAVRFVEHGGSDARTIRTIIIYGVLGAIFFFSGLGLIRSTKDVKSRNEEIT